MLASGISRVDMNPEFLLAEFLEVKTGRRFKTREDYKRNKPVPRHRIVHKDGSVSFL
jgi:hypothetical protein